MVHQTIQYIPKVLSRVSFFIRGIDIQWGYHYTLEPFSSEKKKKKYRVVLHMTIGIPNNLSGTKFERNAPHISDKNLNSPYLGEQQAFSAQTPTPILRNLKFIGLKGYYSKPVACFEAR